MRALILPRICTTPRLLAHGEMAHLIDTYDNTQGNTHLDLLLLHCLTHWPHALNIVHTAPHLLGPMRRQFAAEVSWYDTLNRLPTVCVAETHALDSVSANTRNSSLKKGSRWIAHHPPATIVAEVASAKHPRHSFEQRQTGPHKQQAALQRLVGPRAMAVHQRNLHSETSVHVCTHTTDLGRLFKELVDRLENKHVTVEVKHSIISANTVTCSRQRPCVLDKRKNLQLQRFVPSATSRFPAGSTIQSRQTEINVLDSFSERLPRN